MAGNKVFFTSIVVVLIALIPSVIEFSLRKRFVTNRRGAVLITGASRGIGKSAVEYMASEGYTVFAGVRQQADYDAWKESGNPSIRPVILDIDDQASVDAAYETVKAELHTAVKPVLSAVVNNAAWGSRGPIEFHDLENSLKMFDTNVIGTMRVTRKFLPLLRESKGRLVMVSSLLGKLTVAGTGVYGATKHALEAISDALRLELLPYDISVSVVEPGLVKTDFHETATELSSSLPGEAKDVYPGLFSEQTMGKSKRLVEKAADPTEISAAIAHAINSPEPRTRYPCANFDGIPAWLVAIVSWLVPDRLRDIVLLLP